MQAPTFVSGDASQFVGVSYSPEAMDEYREHFAEVTVWLDGNTGENLALARIPKTPEGMQYYQAALEALGIGLPHKLCVASVKTARVSETAFGIVLGLTFGEGVDANTALIGLTKGQAAELSARLLAALR